MIAETSTRPRLGVAVDCQLPGRGPTTAGSSRPRLLCFTQPLINKSHASCTDHRGRSLALRQPPLRPGRQHGSLEDGRSAAARPHLRHMQRRIAGVHQLDNPLADIPATTSPRETSVSKVNAGTACDDKPQNNTHEHTTAINLIAFT